jgi:hypothetical protein
MSRINRKFPTRSRGLVRHIARWLPRRARPAALFMIMSILGMTVVGCSTTATTGSSTPTGEASSVGNDGSACTILTGVNLPPSWPAKNTFQPSPPTDESDSTGAGSPVATFVCSSVDFTTGTDVLVSLGDVRSSSDMTVIREMWRQNYRSQQVDWNGVRAYVMPPEIVPRDQFNPETTRWKVIFIGVDRDGTIAGHSQIAPSEAELRGVIEQLLTANGSRSSLPE